MKAAKSALGAGFLLQPNHGGAVADVKIANVPNTAGTFIHTVEDRALRGASGFLKKTAA
jgi:hypothetical protein